MQINNLRPASAGHFLYMKGMGKMKKVNGKIGFKKRKFSGAITAIFDGKAALILDNGDIIVAGENKTSHKELKKMFLSNYNRVLPDGRTVSELFHI